MPPALRGGFGSSRPGRPPDVPAGDPAPVGLRSPVASAPSTPSSASCGTADSHAPPRSTSYPTDARPGTPAPSPDPATSASSAPHGVGRIAVAAPAGRPAWPTPWPSGTAGRTADTRPPSAYAACGVAAARG